MPSFMLLVPVCLRMDRASCHSAGSTAGRERATALQPAIGAKMHSPGHDAGNYHSHLFRSLEKSSQAAALFPMFSTVR